MLPRKCKTAAKNKIHILLQQGWENNTCDSDNSRFDSDYETDTEEEEEDIIFSGDEDGDDISTILASTKISRDTENT